MQPPSCTAAALAGSDAAGDQVGEAQRLGHVAVQRGCRQQRGGPCWNEASSNPTTLVIGFIMSV